MRPSVKSPHRVGATRGTLRPARKLARHVLLPPLLAVVAVLCLLIAIAISFGQSAKATNPLAKQPTHDEIAQQLTTDLEGKPTPADIRRAIKPLSERRRLLAKHPYHFLYTIAKERFDVSLYLLAAVHYQETGFKKAPATYATYRRWKRHRHAVASVVRPASYPNQTKRHPHTSDDFDVVMTIAAGLEANGARGGLNTRHAKNAIAKRYGGSPEGRLSAAMVLERARAWAMLGTLPMPGRGELATPVKGIVGGCGYFGCPRPGHLHNGVDFLAPSGTPIHAADVGVVVVVESPGQSGGYGNFVCIQHRPSLASCYAHLSAFAASIRPGARVRRGQVIGLVGSTGHSTAPHLHFEVRRGPAACSSCAVDPLPLLSGEVPAATLPKMVRTAPVAARSSNVAAAAPVAVAPAPTPAAPAPATTTPGAGGTQPTGETGEDEDEAVPDPPIHPTAPPKRPGPASSQSGGSRPTDTTAQKPAPAAPVPAATQPARPVPSAPAPAPPPADAGTGGATADFSPPPPPVAPAAAAPAGGG